MDLIVRPIDEGRERSDEIIVRFGQNISAICAPGLNWWQARFETDTINGPYLTRLYFGRTTTASAGATYQKKVLRCAPTEIAGVLPRPRIGIVRLAERLNSG